MVSITSALAEDFLDTVNAAANSGGAPVLRIYNHTSAPADADAAAAGTELVSLNMTATNTFGGATSTPGEVATMLAATITPAAATASGDPTYARIISNGGTGNVVMQFTCGIGSGDIQFGSSIVSGATVSVTSLTVNMPNEVQA